VDFENALPLYERYISAVEKTFGKEHPGLLKPLREMAYISYTTGDDKETENIVARISQITKSPEDPPNLMYNLSPRATEMNFSINDPAKNQKYNVLLHNAAKGMPFIFADFSPRAAVTGNNTVSNRYIFDLTAPFAQQTGSSGSFVAWKMSSALVQISVSESGKVEKAEAITSDSALKKDAENKVMKWQFKPFSYHGVAKKMRGWTVFYQIF
jgi:hypothetical protein